MEGYEKRGYLLENFRLFHLRSEGGEQVDFHYHEFCKVLLLVSGQGGYYVDGQHYLLRPGDILLIGSRSIHRPELDAHVPYERIILYVSPEYLQRMSTADCDLPGIFGGCPLLRPGEPQRKRIFSQAAALERDLSQEGFGREILSSTGILRLLVELGRSRGESAGDLPEPLMPESRRVLEIMAYLDENLTEEVDLDTLAEVFFLSKFYLMRLFRRETGTTVHGYLLRKRLLLARQQMDAGMSATEACYLSGFRSYSSFTRAYGKYFGTSPTGRSDRHLAREADFE